MQQDWIGIDTATEEMIMAGAVSTLTVPESHMAEYLAI
ncbi:MAG: hypothetical protein CSYNP_02813 [Syntrophus sp. SKADARSKE-3]|nr:hypothetical protein [Syntrophus sp. SKADARSKE-3]